MLLLLLFFLAVLSLASAKDKYQTYDYIVLGSGVGAATAHRLASSGASVLVLEQGGDFCEYCNRSIATEISTVAPASVYKVLSQESPGLNGRGNLLYGYKGLGGATNIWTAIANRATPEQLLKNPVGWRYPDLLPYYKQVEDHFCHYLPESYTGISPEDCVRFHGKDGQMHIQDPHFPDTSDFVKEFIAAAKAGSFPDPYTVDFNNPTGHYGYTYCQNFFNLAGDKTNPTTPRIRSTTARNYLNTAPRDKLTVITFAKAQKLIIKDGIVRGVSYLIKGTGFPKVALARKEVIVAMGTYESPKFLELNGIGDPDILSQYGIPVVGSNKQVGANLKIHHAILLGYETSAPIVKDTSLNGDSAILGFLKSKFSPELQGAIQVGFIEGYVINNFDLSYTGPGADLVAAFTNAAIFRPGQPGIPMMGIVLTNTNPKSVGSVHLQSSDWNADPLVNLGLDSNSFGLGSPDYQDLVDSIKQIRDLVNGDSEFAKKWFVKEVYPGDQFISQYRSQAPNLPEPVMQMLAEQFHITHDTNTAYHTTGTLGLGQATDLNGAVLGVRGLTAVGNAVMPIIPDANPTHTSLAFALKIADHLVTVGSSNTVPMTDDQLAKVADDFLDALKQ